MTVQNVIDQLKSGEFKNLSSKAFDETIVISYINLALIELYKRFRLRTEETVVDLDDNTTLYTLPNDCMLVIEAYDEGGKMCSINDENDALSILTPSWNQIQVPNPATGGSIFVIYVASPIWLTAVDDELPIPPQMLEALLHYCGYRANMTIDGEAQAESNVHYMRFEASCKRLKELGLFTQDDVNYKFSTQDKGFV